MTRFHLLTVRIFIVLLILSITLTIGCSKDAHTDNDNTLYILTQTWITEKFQLEKAAQDFMRDNPGVEIFIDKYDNYNSSFNPLASKTNRKKYDIFIGWSREHTVQYAASGVIKSFDTDFFDADFQKEDFFPSFLELGNIDGNQFMIPLMGEVMSIIVRKDLFEQAGLTDSYGNIIPAKDWDELYLYAKKLADLDENKKLYGINIDFGNNMILNSFYASLQASRGSIFDSESLYIDITSSYARNILKKWRQLVNERLAPSYTFEDVDAGRENFKAGNVAMLLAPHSRWVEAQAALGKDKVGIMLIPGADKNGSLTYIHGITIPAASQNRPLAIKFIKQKLLSSGFQLDSMSKYGKIPSLIRNYDVGMSPEWKTIFDLVRNSTTLPLYKDWSKFDKFFQVEVQKCIVNKQSVDKTVETLSEQLDKLDKSTGYGF
jgi:ABC-type glycerol-3-phosphate transport system substrate-binding protein